MTHLRSSIAFLTLCFALSPAAPAQTIDLAVQKGSSTQRFYAGRPPAASFAAGDHVNATVNVAEAHQAQFKDRSVTVEVALTAGGKPLVAHSYPMDYDGYRQLQVALVPNPTVFPNESWSGRYALALAGLPTGTHALQLDVSLSADAAREQVGSLQLQFENRAGSDYAQKARAIEEKLGKSPEELEQAFIASAGEMQIDHSRYTIGQRAAQVTATAMNNCGSSTKPFRHGESDWITLDGNGGKRRFSAAVGTPLYRSDSGSPKLVTTLNAAHEGATIPLCP